MIPLYERAFTNFLFSVEMLCASLLFSGAYRKRRLWLCFFVLGVVTLAGAALGLRAMEDWVIERVFPLAGEDNFLLVYAITLVSNLLLAGIVIFFISRIYRTTWKNTVFISIAASTVRVIARCLFFLMFSLRGLHTSHLWDMLFSEPLWGGLYLLVYAIVFILVYCFFLRDYRETDDDLLPNRILEPTCLIVVLGFLFANVNAPEGNTEFQIYLLLQLAEILISVLILMLQFYALGWLQLRLQNAAMAQMVEGQQRQFTLSQESMDAVNLNAHDLKHKVHAIMRSLDGQDQGALRAELKGISDTISEWDSIYQTGCRPLDIVLTEKAQVCRQMETELSVMADGSRIQGMADLDIYSLFSNALDNAIEAVREIPEESRRLIILSIQERNGFTMIRMENTYQHKPSFVNGALATSKEDKLFHGFGVRSIRNTVEKYGGHMEIEVTSELFCLRILMPAFTQLGE